MAVRFTGSVTPPNFRPYNTSVSGNRITVSNFQIPRGKAFTLLPGWRYDRTGNLLQVGQGMSEINNTGNIFIDNGRFSPFAPTEQARNYAGQLIGQVFEVGESGCLDRTSALNKVVPLGSLGSAIQRNLTLDQPAIAKRIIEIRPSADAGKLTTIERRIDTFKEDENSSLFRYRINDEGVAIINGNIHGDPTWIHSVQVHKDRSGATVFYYANGDRNRRPLESFVIPTRCFADNYGKLLLDNQEQEMTSIKHLFQDTTYSEETEIFRPRLDIFENIWCLYVNKTRTYEIDAPKEPLPKDFRIFPSAAGGAVRIGEDWYPLNISEPLSGIRNITNLSKVIGTKTNSAITVQNKLFDLGQFGGEYARDDYFYGLMRFVTVEMFMRASYDFAMNRGKYVRAERGIQSGRTHVLDWEMLFNDILGDLIDTNSPFYKKMMNFGSHFWPSGVSEDTQLELVNWLLGMKMMVVSKASDLETQESNVAAFVKQNAYRYILSEELFDPISRAVFMELFEQVIGKDTQAFTNWHEASEVMAGRTWYKFPFAKTAEFASIPVFFGSNGTALFFPVDYTYFTISWAARLACSLANYGMQLNSLGMMLRAGFWTNQVNEDLQLASYLKTALSHYLYRNQYANFVQTRESASKPVPYSNLTLLAGTSGAIAGTMGWQIANLIRGGIDQLIAGGQSLGIWANLVFGTMLAGRAIHSIVKGIQCNLYQKRSGDQVPMKDFAKNNARLFEAYQEAAQYMGVRIDAAAKFKDSRFDRKDTRRKSVDYYEGFSFDELFHHREQLQCTLQSIGCFSSGSGAALPGKAKRSTQGRIKLALSNKHFEVGTKIADLYTNIETIICLKAYRNIRDGVDVPETLVRLKELAEGTREYQVVLKVAEIMRQFGINP